MADLSLASAPLAPDAPAVPSPALRRLDVLVGTWEVDGRDLTTGEAIRGDVTFAWMHRGFYLVQHVALDYAGRRVNGVEYISHDERDRIFRSCFFGDEGPGPYGGIALEYVWELGRDTLRVRAADASPPAKFEGSFDDGAGTISGRWEWPGGGYAVTMTRAGGRAP